MKRLLSLALILALVVACADDEGRRTEDFNFGWRFSLGDFASWSEPSYDDGAWRELHLPHDWSIEGEFSKSNPAGPNGGALPGGVGWYRKHFKTSSGGRTFVEFDGVYMNSTVYLNGKELGTRPYGYSSFCYELTDVLKPVDEDNVIAVRVDNSRQPSGRWYTGCGIYRNVRLVTTSKERFVYNGVFVSAPRITPHSATIAVETEVDAAKGTEYKVLNTIYDATGKKVCEGDSVLEVINPHLWDVSDPYLYKLVSRLEVKGRMADTFTTKFGIRSLAWDKDSGFELNGRPLKIHGVCLHHDLGCLGSAVHKRAIERQIRILKEMGVNAVRTSHNMPAPELLDVCDEEGILVMDEAFDSWRRPKARYDYDGRFEEWHTRDLADFVSRDRNHPCVFMWSIGNEIPEQSAKTDEEREANLALTKELAQTVRLYDTTRVVTAGTNSVDYNNCLMRSGALDVIGLNYHDYGYDSLRVWYPNTPLVASETASALNSRGIYYQPSTELRTLPRWTFFSKGPKPEEITNEEPVFHQCTAYDICHAFWETTLTHQDAWLVVKNRPWMAGVFVWTSFDYLGEPTAFSWPSRSSYFGICDLAGFPKDPYYMYQSEWTQETMLHLLPHWNWKEGDKIDVWAYYNGADTVELFLNGRSLGQSAKNQDRLHAFWPEVPFEAGRLEAVSYKEGKKVSCCSRETTGTAARLKLTADREKISADGYDLSFICVEALDDHGRVVPDAELELDFSVEGAGELFGVDNGNAADTLSLKGTHKRMFSGKALAVVRSIKGERGSAVLRVSSPIGDAEINIKTK